MSNLTSIFAEPKDVTFNVPAITILLPTLVAVPPVIKELLLSLPPPTFISRSFVTPDNDCEATKVFASVTVLTVMFYAVKVNTCL